MNTKFDENPSWKQNFETRQDRQTDLSKVIIIFHFCFVKALKCQFGGGGETIKKKIIIWINTCRLEDKLQVTVDRSYWL